VRFKDLSGLARPRETETALAALPEKIHMAKFAMEKAFKLNDLVRAIHGGSYEWYGYTLGGREAPELILDIGLPVNDMNVPDYTSVSPEGIAAFRESLSSERVINGWIHSHGSLDFEGFSDTDERNQATVLDFVASLLRKPVAKREVVIKDLAMLVEGRYGGKDLERGSVSLVTDVPVGRARILETVYGGFCYSVVIGDRGWHRQEIRWRRRGILSGWMTESRKGSGMDFVDTGRTLTKRDVDALAEEVRERIRPAARSPRERYEKECT
jgi:hypothetical protein